MTSNELWMVAWPQVSLSLAFISCHFTARCTTSVNSCCKYPLPPPSLSFSSPRLWSNLRYSLRLCPSFFILCCSRVVRQMLWAEQQASPEQCLFQVHLSASRSDRLKPCISSVSLSICQEESGRCWKPWLCLCTADGSHLELIHVLLANSISAIYIHLHIYEQKKYIF